MEMYYRDHPPPHFHVYYGDEGAIIDIATMRITQGALPSGIHRLITRWAIGHRDVLRENWRRAAEHEPLLWIEPHE